MRPVLFWRTVGYRAISFFGGVSAIFMRTTACGEISVAPACAQQATNYCELLFVRPTQNA
ncbi:MAG: hypothetical protein DCC52_06845 [Chloroflexi bacterium]|nr:MAG: hypothetical protein DCC52_06845 [Chloroflexota bacterium]